MTTTLRKNPTTTAQDAILLKLRAPLVQFDAFGRVARDEAGNVRVRKASKDAIELSGMPMADIGETMLRQIGPSALRNAMSGMTRPKLCSLMLNRGLLARYFPAITPGSRPVALSGTATGDYPNLLADSLNKAALAHYAMARRSWRGWAKRGEVRDFKQAERPSLDDAPALRELPEGAAVDYVHLPERPTETFTLGTYGLGYKLTRQTLLNDDTEALANFARIVASSAYRLEDSLAYGVLTANATMADGNTLFSTAHANVASGALTAANLGAAMAKISSQRNDNGDTLDLQAARLIVPSNLKMTAETVLSAVANAQRSTDEGTLSLTSSALLEDDSTAQWYVATDPSVLGSVEMTFLENTDGPRIASESEFDTDSMKIKVVHDVAATAVDHRGIVRSSGE